MADKIKVKAPQAFGANYAEQGYIFEMGFATWSASTSPYTYSSYGISPTIPVDMDKGTVLQLLTTAPTTEYSITTASIAGHKIEIYVATTSATLPSSPSLQFLCYPVSGEKLTTIRTGDYSGKLLIVNPQNNGIGGSGTTDHTQLTNRDSAGQHPISAITNLQSTLDGKADDTDLTAEITRATAAEQALDDKFDEYLPLSGGTVRGDIEIGGSNSVLEFLNSSVAIEGYSNNNIGLTPFHNMKTPTDDYDGANKIYVDSRTPNYSTTEIATNRAWTDGKTIYQRTISGSVSATTTLTSILLLAQTDIDRLINSYGSIGRRVSTNLDQWTIPVYPLMASRQVALFTANTGFKMYCKWDFATTLYYDVTFEYTKNE